MDSGLPEKLPGLVHFGRGLLPLRHLVTRDSPGEKRSREAARCEPRTKTLTCCQCPFFSRGLSKVLKKSLCFPKRLEGKLWPRMDPFQGSFSWQSSKRNIALPLCWGKLYIYIYMNMMCFQCVTCQNHQHEIRKTWLRGAPNVQGRL